MNTGEMARNPFGIELLLSAYLIIDFAQSYSKTVLPWYWETYYDWCTSPAAESEPPQQQAIKNLSELLSKRSIQLHSKKRYVSKPTVNPHQANA